MGEQNREIAGAATRRVWSVVGAASRDEGGDRPDAVLDLFAHVEQAGALGSQHPLVAAGGVGVDLQLFDIHGEHTRRLSAVAGQQDILWTGDGGDFGQGHAQPGGRIYVAEAADPGARGDAILDELQDFVLTRCRSRKMDLAHAHPVQFGHVQPAHHAARMFVIGGENLVTGLQAHATGHQVHALGGVAGQEDLVGVGPQKAGGGLLNRVEGTGPDARPGLSIGIFL